MEVELIKIIILRRLVRRKKNKARSRLWVRPINLMRDIDGFFAHLFPDLVNDPYKFYNLFRMSYESFIKLKDLVRMKIQKQNTNYRKAIPPEHRLAIFLRYLATGESFASLSESFRVGESTVHKIVSELNETIWKTLQPRYMAVPTAQDWLRNGDSFSEICNVPNCIGSIAGKHCAIKCPPKAGSQYLNYKNFHSIVLTAIADAKNNFIMIEVGRSNDSSIFSESAMGKAFVSNELQIPDSLEIHEANLKIPFYLAGDEAFPLRYNLMRPYPERELDFPERIFNYRLSVAHRTVECAFGILAKRFGIFHKSIASGVEMAEASIRSACVLHNYIRQNEEDNALEKIFLEETREPNELPPIAPTSDRGTTEALKIRESLKNYFISPAGSLPWQNYCIGS